ncbi:unnamed protein product [Chilo suppressalis]|uniref:Cytochrome b5 n=1 Tax=Chilo suppressalis TaxID=168631 RepID=A0ABN8B3Q4_CHISP|nr:unnamed protein product [Chilo suppressalis]
MSSEIISLNEVNKHKTKKSCWMVIHNQVYDVTKFLEEHPGGEDALLEYAGKDGTQAFEDVGHSEDARELLKKFKIGLLPQGERAKDVAKHCDGSGGGGGGKLKWALLALAGAIVIGVVLKKYMS